MYKHTLQMSINKDILTDYIIIIHLFISRSIKAHPTKSKNSNIYIHINYRISNIFSEQKALHEADKR